MSAHTPGPWVVSDWTNVFADRTGGEGICVVNYKRNLDRAFADARLIAAAPELLAAAEKVIRDGYGPAFVELREAVKRARGE